MKTCFHLKGFALIWHWAWPRFEKLAKANFRNDADWPLELTSFPGSLLFPEGKILHIAGPKTATVGKTTSIFDILCSHANHIIVFYWSLNRSALQLVSVIISAEPCILNYLSLSTQNKLKTFIYLLIYYLFL